MWLRSLHTRMPPMFATPNTSEMVLLSIVSPIRMVILDLLKRAALDRILSNSGVAVVSVQLPSFFNVRSSSGFWGFPKCFIAARKRSPIVFVDPSKGVPFSLGRHFSRVWVMLSPASVGDLLLTSVLQGKHVDDA